MNHRRRVVRWTSRFVGVIGLILLSTLAIPPEWVRPLVFGAEGKSTFAILASLLAGLVLVLVLGAASLFGIPLSLAAAAWGLFHPKAVMPGAATAAKWAVVLTLVMAGGLKFSGTPVLWLEDEPTYPQIAASMLASYFAFGLLGAAIGAFLARKHDDGGHGAVAGVNCWWTAALLSLAGLTAYLHLNHQLWSPTVGGAMLGMLPILERIGGPQGASTIRVLALFGVGIQGAGAAFILRLIRDPVRRPSARLQAGYDRITQRLVWRVQLGPHTRRIDLRGAAIGGTAAAMAAVCSALGLLTPLEDSLLVGAMQVRNLRPPAPPAGVELRRARERAVLLQLDSAARYAMSRRSEVAVQAEMVRAVARWRPSCIVLPLPRLDPVITRGSSRLSEEQYASACRDAEGLARAMRDSGKVVLSLPGLLSSYEGMRTPASAACDRLDSAALDVGTEPLNAINSTDGRLPCISSTWVSLPDNTKGRAARREYPPVSILLAAAVHGVLPRATGMGSEPVPILRREGDGIELGGVHVPVMDSDRVLVDFDGASRDRSFVRVTYGAVLRAEPVPEPTPDLRRAPNWQTAPEFFKDKIVFLDSPGEETRLSPIGELPPSELQAHALVTLLSGRALRPTGAAAGFLAVLLIGTLVGAWGAGRGTLQAALPTGLVCAGAVVVSFVLADRASLWWNCGPAVVGAVLAMVLATHFSYLAVREERERNRALLQRFVAPQVIHHYLDDPEANLALGGTRRRVCVLFADARGSSLFAERLTPEQVIAVMNRYLTAMTDALFKHEGILDKYTGDGLMAMFIIGDDAGAGLEGALRAALAMRDAVRVVSAGLEAEKQDSLEFGFGLHYGDAVVGLVGNPIQFNYTAMGHAVVVAQRFQGAAAGGEVLVSEQVADAVTGRFELVKRDPLMVKGVSESLAVYQVVR